MQYTPIVLGFTAGELSPWLSTRIDLQAYQRGAALLCNFLVQPYGGLRRRRGTTLVGPAPVRNPRAIRLFAFHYSESDALILVLYPGGMQVYRDGELLTVDGVPYELPLPWTSVSEIESLRLVQVNDAVFATCRSFPPMGLYRYGDTNWTCEELTLDPFPRETYVPQLSGIRVQMASDMKTATVRFDSTNNGLVAAMAGEELLLADAPISERTLFQNKTFSTGATELPNLAQNAVLAGRSYYVKDSATSWYHFYTCRRGHNQGAFNGSYSPADYPDSFLPGVMRLDENEEPYEVCGDWQIQTNGEWDAVWELWRSYDTKATSNDFLRWSWTRIRSFGQDGYSSRKNWAISGSEEQPCRMVLVCRSAKALTVPACVYFRIEGGVREYKMRVNSVTNSQTAQVQVLSSYLGKAQSFYTRNWSWGAFGVRNGYPRFSGIHQGRLWFGGTPGQGTTLFASATDDFGNFRVGSNDDQALHLTLAADDQSRICWICPARSLLVGTSASEWTLASADGSAVTASNATFTRQSSVGSEVMDACPMENAVFYVQRGGKRLREISYKLEADGFTSTDTSLFAEHLFDGGVKAWAVQRGTNPLLWVLMHDGSLGVLTMNMEQRVTAWQRVQFPGRRVCHLASIAVAGGSEDELWFVLQNEVNGHLSLERMGESTSYLDGLGQVQVVEGRLCAGPHLAGLEGMVYDEGMLLTEQHVMFDEEGYFVLPEGSPLADLHAEGQPLWYAVSYYSELQTMPMETETSFNAVHQMGRVKLRLLASEAVFEYRASHAESWEKYDGRSEMHYHPFSGAIRLSHLPAPGVGQGFCLRYSGRFDFCLLSLTVDMDFHGR